MGDGRELWLVAADPREFAGVLRHCRGVRRMAGGVEWLRRGDLKGRAVWMAANGAGPGRAAEALTFLYRQGGSAVVVSTGFCGALQEGLPIGAIVAATELRGAGEPLPLPLPAASRGFHAGPVLSLDRVVASAGEKRRLAASGALAVEMEAAGLVPLVRQWNLPFFCVRSVSDLASEDFCLDLNGARRPDGRISVVRLVWQALRQPMRGPAELLRLRRQSARAARSLGDFLADCRF
jgi:nucleoside phosphorylase